MKLTIYCDRKGEYRWRLQSANGRIIACSGEGFTRKRDARRAWSLVAQAELGEAIIVEADE